MDNICIITINNPKSKNALSSFTLKELSSAIEEAKRNPKIRVVIFTGAGEEAFCSGADLKERLSMNEIQALATVKNIQDTFNKIAMLSIPTIAAIKGMAFGGGLELALACDLRFASPNAKMGLTECSLGVIPGAGGTQRLPKIVGLAKACELIFTAKKIDAEEAINIGLVNGLCAPDEEVLDYAISIAKIIALQAPLSIKVAKKAIYRNINIDLEYELKCYEEILYSKDRKEGLQAFKEKRAAHFIGE